MTCLKVLPTPSLGVGSAGSSQCPFNTMLGWHSQSPACVPSQEPGGAQHIPVCSTGRLSKGPGGNSRVLWGLLLPHTGTQRAAQPGQQSTRPQWGSSRRHRSWVLSGLGLCHPVLGAEESQPWRVPSLGFDVFGREGWSFRRTFSCGLRWMHTSCTIL